VQVIRDAVTEMLAADGMTVVWDAVETGALAPGLALMQVVSVTPRTPGFLRVRLRGPESARFTTGGLHFRLLLPQPGRQPVWPRIAATGRTQWPEGEDALHRPVHTVVDHGSDWLAFDLFRHAGSPTCTSAETVAQGTETAIIGPGGGWCPDAENLLLFGDETALPASARMLDLATGRRSAFVSASVADLGDVRATRVGDLLDTMKGTGIPPCTVCGSPHAKIRRADRAQPVRNHRCGVPSRQGLQRGPSCALSAAARIAASVASRRPQAMFPRKAPPNRNRS
jgi:NADPH-dependent ferric siderophore reductase